MYSVKAGRINEQGEPSMFCVVSPAGRVCAGPFKTEAEAARKMRTLNRAFYAKNAA